MTFQSIGIHIVPVRTRRRSGLLVYLQLIDSPEEQSRFEDLYITYRKLMFHVAKGILGNDQDAEDAVHDAFLHQQFVEH